MALKLTDAQKNAINEQGNILVSAAAGSGKTAVLVERVISKICNKENPVRADELLIVTFTNAAASEMRSRIENRLEDECRKHPEDTGLLLQRHLLTHSKICTIDSFCIDLVRENFEKLDISPDFKISDHAALEQIDSQVLHSIINRYLEEKDPLFFELLDIVGAEFDEQNFADLVLSVYQYSRQLPFPKEWFESLCKNFDSGVFSKENIWYQYAFNNAEKHIKMMQNTVNNAIEILNTNGIVFDAYSSVFFDCKRQIDELESALKTGEWDEFYKAILNYKLLKLPSVRGLSDVPQVNAVKDTYKFLGGKAVEYLQKFFYNDSNFINLQFKKLEKPLNLFVKILCEFQDELFSAYKQENTFTFHNTEHLALQLLCCVKDGRITVNSDATELLDQYKEIMVDEYQDTNDLQNMLFFVLSNFEEKLFVVGDIKQSIYAFRGANPAHFLQKKNNAIGVGLANEGQPKKIILGNNFRSKPQVCEFVNFFFEIFMQSQMGSIVYDDEEKLIPSAVFPETDDLSVSFDILDCSTTNEKSLILEARQIANFIKQTINGKPCIKQDDNTLRQASYGDFTILLRSVTNRAPELISELKKQGIPLNMSIGNFADSVEISTFLSLLKVIDNPQSDIELLTLLMSPIFCFSADEMAQIRANKRDGNLYSAIIFAKENGNQHADEFLKKIENFRLDAVTLPLAKLISKLLITTEYLNVVFAMSDGEQRRNNLLLLIDLAEQYSTTDTSISSFIKFVLKQTQSISGKGFSGGDSVKIMSIHASKGLQFPVCIVASTASKFNDAESRNSAAFSTKYGIGFKYFDEIDKQKYTTLSREVILDDLKQNALEEELRLLYVAMTRSQDKLHFVSSFSNLDKAIQGYKNLLISSNNIVDYGLFLRTKSYADWLIIALLLHPQAHVLRESGDAILPLETKSKIKVNLIDGETLTIDKNNTQEKTLTPDKSSVADYKAVFDYEYPYKQLENLSSKMSVSLLANSPQSDKYNFTAKPQFMNVDGLSAAGRGTAMHKVMQYFDFKKSNDIESEIERLYEWQFISEQEKNALNIKALKEFFASETFMRIFNSNLVKREMRFITELTAQKIDNTLDDTYREENIIVQGAVDICFVEDEELVILDFKTDSVESIDELSETYGEQLRIYANACEKIFGLKVKEKLIYSFSKSQTVQIK